MNVFHAGDGNLHPLLVFDGRDAGVWERVHAAGDEILAPASTPGGVLSGEHGIGLEKRDAMPLVFDPRRPGRPGPRSGTRSTPTASPTRTRSCRGAAAAARSPGCPRGRGCEGRGRALQRASAPRSPAAAAVVAVGAGTHAGGRRRVTRARPRSGSPRGDRRVRPGRHDRHRRRRDDVRRPRRRARRARPGVPARPARSGRHRRRHARRPGSRGVRRLGLGPLRDRVLEVRSSSATADVVRGGGPTVKNVTGYDMPRLLVGSLGTLGVLTQVIAALPARARRPRSGATVDAPAAVVGAASHAPSRCSWDGRPTTSCSRATPTTSPPRPRPLARSAARRPDAARTVRTGVASRWRPAGSTRSRAAPRRRRRVRWAGGARGRHRPRRRRRRPAGWPRPGGSRTATAAGCSARPARPASTRFGVGLPASAGPARGSGRRSIPTGKLSPGPGPRRPEPPCSAGAGARPRRRRARRLRRLRTVPARTARPIASPGSRSRRRGAGSPPCAPSSRGPRRSTPRSSARWTRASSAAAARPPARRAVPFGRLMEDARGTAPATPDRAPGAARVAECRRASAWCCCGTGACSSALTRALAVAQRLHLVPRRFGLPRLSLRRCRPRSPPTPLRDAYLFTGLRDGRLAARRPPRGAAGRCGPAGARVGLPGPGADCCGALHVHAGRRRRRRAPGPPGHRRIARRHADRRRQRRVRRRDAGLRAPARHARGRRLRRSRRRLRDVARRTARLPLRGTGTDRRRAGPVPPAPRPARARRRARGARPAPTTLASTDDDGLCCGAGGAYSVLEPELSEAVRDRKVAALARAAAGARLRGRVGQPRLCDAPRRRRPRRPPSVAAPGGMPWT